MKERQLAEDPPEKLALIPSVSSGCARFAVVCHGESCCQCVPVLGVVSGADVVARNVQLTMDDLDKEGRNIPIEVSCGEGGHVGRISGQRMGEEARTERGNSLARGKGAGKGRKTRDRGQGADDVRV